MSSNKIVSLVIKYFKSMGYTIEPMTIPEDFKGSKFRNASDLSLRLVNVKLPTSFA